MPRKSPEQSRNRSPSVRGVSAARIETAMVDAAEPEFKLLAGLAGADRSSVHLAMRPRIKGATDDLCPNRIYLHCRHIWSRPR
jgi:hypothetical protein